MGNVLAEVLTEVTDLWEGVIATGVPGVAAAEATDPQPQPLKHPETLNRLSHVVRTGGIKPAGRG